MMYTLKSTRNNNKYFFRCLVLSGRGARLVWIRIRILGSPVFIWKETEIGHEHVVVQERNTMHLQNT